MAIITIDTDTKEIKLETIKAKMIENFLNDNLMMHEALQRLLDLEDYSIKALPPKKANKKKEGITIDQMKEYIKSKKDQDAIDQFNKILSQEIPMKSKKTGEVMLNKEGKPRIQSNYIAARAWYLDYYSKKEGIERKK